MFVIHSLWYIAANGFCKIQQLCCSLQHVCIVCELKRVIFVASFIHIL